MIEQARPLVMRTLFGVALWLGLGASLLADDVDPEPRPKGASVAKSGDVVARADKGGTVTVTKGGKALWATTLRDGFGCESQVVIAAERVVVARDCVQTGIDLATGKILWCARGTWPKGSSPPGAAASP